MKYVLYNFFIKLWCVYYYGKVYGLMVRACVWYVNDHVFESWVMMKKVWFWFSLSSLIYFCRRAHKNLSLLLWSLNSLSLPFFNDKKRS